MSPPSIEPLAPFGVILHFEEDTPFGAIAVDEIHAWVREHRVVVMRGCRAPERMRLPLDARRLGPLQAWSFGSIHELEVKPDTDNYLYTDRAVPLHWDGAFAGEAPRYLVFHCLEAPSSAGGETELVDTARVWAKLDPAMRDRFRALQFRYTTEKKAHYGGSFVSPLVVEHETRGDAVLRFAEPVDDLNAVRVEAVGLDPLQSAALIGEVRKELRRADCLLAHRWEPGDIVIADNLGLLHGRAAFPAVQGAAQPRRIRRVNVLRARARTLGDTARDSIRIRRPEFMVAEIPIFLIPALLSGRTFDAADWIEVAILFFLLFHVGDMVNCLADRSLDAVYKTRLSEAVLGLGVRNVKAQIIGSCAAALGLAAERSMRSERWEPFALVAAGLLLGFQYSLHPLFAKGRGLLQIITLWALLFVGPMTLVWTSFGRHIDVLPLALFGAYGLMQQGIVLVNTAEDIPEDRACGLHTSAISLGVERSLALARLMVVIGGLGTVGILGWMLQDDGDRVVISLLSLTAALAVVVYGIGSARNAVRAKVGGTERVIVDALRPHARHVPLWITLTALGALVAAAVHRC